jgi:hypothetical protein
MDHGFSYATLIWLADVVMNDRNHRLKYKAGFNEW